MRAISIISSDPEKTSLLCKNLTKHLVSRNYRVSVILQEESDSVHTSQKKVTTSEYSCSKILHISSRETHITWATRKEIQDLLPLLEADVLIVEGGGEKGLDWIPEVYVSDRNHTISSPECSNEKTILRWGTDQHPEINTTDDIEKLADTILEKGFTLPGLNCGGCGRSNCTGLTKDILKKNADIHDCAALHSKITVTVNGTKLSMNPFIANLYHETFRTMLNQLKGSASGRAVIVFDI